MVPTPEILDAIRHAAAWFAIPYNLLYCQVQQESQFNPHAVSPCGAKGLLQLMPQTGEGLGLKDDEFFDIEKNLSAGARYLKQQFKGMKAYCSQEKPADDELWKMSLAAYNGGAGYIFRAIALLRVAQKPVTWANIAIQLQDKSCTVRGRHPDDKQITDYVARIWTHYEQLESSKEE